MTLKPPTADTQTPAIDGAAASRFLAEVRPRLDRAYRLAGLLLGSATDAEDAVGDALLAAWRAQTTLRDGDRFGAWFDRIVVNACRDRLRRRRTVQFVPLEGHDPAGSDPFAVLLAQDALLRHLATLTEDERAIVVLHYWADQRLEDVAAALGIPLGTVKSRLHRALERLREAHAAEEVVR